jgi:hypothetical protein
LVRGLTPSHPSTNPSAQASSPRHGCGSATKGQHGCAQTYFPDPHRM